jgi:hypothetical protein
MTKPKSKDAESGAGGGLLGGLQFAKGIKKKLNPVKNRKSGGNITGR